MSSIVATEALAERVRAAMHAMGDPTYDEVGAMGGPSGPTLSKILHAEGTFSRTTAKKLEKAFDWPPGAVAAIVRGGDPDAGPVLRAAREARGLSLRALADLLGIGPRSLDDMEDGDVEIPESVQRQLLALFPDAHIAAEATRRILDHGA
jgi:plasmid maintenance system antidote protein VapI